MSFRNNVMRDMRPPGETVLCKECVSPGPHSRKLLSPTGRIVRHALFALMTLLLLVFAYPSYANVDVVEAGFSRLEHIRNKKKAQLIEYCNQVHELAKGIKQDELMLSFFDVKKKYYDLQQSVVPPDKAQQAIGELKAEMRDYYVQHYLTFYDILFIDTKGDVFYTIKKEYGYHDNIFAGELGQTRLSQDLKKHEQQEFVDFQYFFPSGEPAAFFIEPAYKGEEHLGWFVLQCAINKVNALFMDDEGLGETGEVFLVNKEQYLLSDSRFIGDSTILKGNLNKDNIESKFRERAGNKIVMDYRGFRVLSSFQVFSFLGSEWLIIAKIDEDEIITEYFKEHRKEVQEELIKHYAHSAATDVRHGNSLQQQGKKTVRVDMDEFMKVYDGECLQTRGISTCTGVIAAYPGKFAYMGHISPLDRIYSENGSDLLGYVIKKIKVYDLYKYQRRYVRFVIIANHTDSILCAVDRLVDEGFLLSQISFLHNPKAKSVAVTYDCSIDAAYVEWKMTGDRSETMLQSGRAANSLGNVVKQLVGIRT